jgi:hypothetical protein
VDAIWVRFTKEGHVELMKQMWFRVERRMENKMYGELKLVRT